MRKFNLKIINAQKCIKYREKRMKKITLNPQGGEPQIFFFFWNCVFLIVNWLQTGHNLFKNMDR